MLRVILLLLGGFFTLHVHAFPCFLTMVKDSCWTNYTLTVTVTNANTEATVATVIVPQGQSWVRQAFTCQPGDDLSLKATFTPVFWESDEGKVYPALRDWKLPDTVNKGDTAWNITVCYPEAFSEVPLPPDASSNCKCATDNIPPVPPQ